jgi:hypothetical protein
VFALAEKTTMAKAKGKPAKSAKDKVVPAKQTKQKETKKKDKTANVKAPATNVEAKEENDNLR